MLVNEKKPVIEEACFRATVFYLNFDPFRGAVPSIPQMYVPVLSLTIHAYAPSHGDKQRLNNWRRPLLSSKDSFSQPSEFLLTSEKRAMAHGQMA